MQVLWTTYTSQFSKTCILDKWVGSRQFLYCYPLLRFIWCEWYERHAEMELKNSGLYVFWIPFKIGVVDKGQKNLKSQLPYSHFLQKKPRKCQPISALAENLCCELYRWQKNWHFLTHSIWQIHSGVPGQNGIWVKF